LALHSSAIAGSRDRVIAWVATAARKHRHGRGSTVLRPLLVLVETENCWAICDTNARLCPGPGASLHTSFVQTVDLSTWTKPSTVSSQEEERFAVRDERGRVGIAWPAMGAKRFTGPRTHMRNMGDGAASPGTLPASALAVASRLCARSNKSGPGRRFALTGVPRALALVLSALLVAACSDGTTSPAAGTFTPRIPGVLTVVTTDIPSPGFWEGTPASLTGGFEYELARLLAKRFGLRSVQVRTENFNRIVSGRLDGADLALDLISPTSERERSLAFSSPYLDSAPTVLVRTGTAVPDLATAQGLRWGVVRGTTFVGIVNTLVGPDQPTRVYDDTSALVTAIEDRQIDAVLLDLPLAVVTADRSHGRLSAAAQLPETEMIAAAMPKGSGNQEAVDSALRAFTADGSIDHLLRVWVGTAAADAETSIPLLQTTR
jgi:polar amino acid transport system substrate-binding protein